MSALNDADLSWSILTTHVQYTKAAEYSCFKPMNDSRCFRVSNNKILVKLNVLKMSVVNTLKKFLGVLSNSSNFEEHVNVMTTYIGRYMAQWGLECLIQKM